MLRDEVVYRAAAREDALDLAVLGAQAFVEDWGNRISPDALTAHLLRTYSPERQAEELERADTWSILGARDREVVGAALFRHRAMPLASPGTAGWVEIQRFVLARIYRRTGLAADLMAASLKSIRSRGGQAVWLSVWERAGSARRFYRKWGFEEIPELASTPSVDPMPALILARSLGFPPAQKSNATARFK